MGITPCSLFLSNEIVVFGNSFTFNIKPREIDKIILKKAFENLEKIYIENRKKLKLESKIKIIEDNIDDRDKWYNYTEDRI